jgi:hypothetical protein
MRTPSRRQQIGEAARADLRALASDPDMPRTAWATDTLSTGALRRFGHRNRTALRAALRTMARELTGDDRDE